MGENEFPEEAWNLAGLEKKRSLGPKVFSDPGYCNQLMDCLAHDSVELLFESLCRNEWSHILQIVRSYEEWVEMKFQVDQVIVRSEKLPGTGEWRLEELAKLREIREDPFFNQLPLSKSVEFDVFVGIWDGSSVRLVDGVRRAVHEARRIQEGRSKTGTLRIVVPVL